MAPHFLGHKRSKWMQQSQTCIKHFGKSGHGLLSALFILQLPLRDLHIPIRKVRPDEVVYLLPGLAILEVLELTFHITDELFEAGGDPLVSQCQTWTIDRGRLTIMVNGLPSIVQ